MNEQDVNTQFRTAAEVDGWFVIECRSCGERMIPIYIEDLLKHVCKETQP